MGDINEIELVLESQEDGGYHVYAPDLPGLHTQGSDFNDAMANVSEAIVHRRVSLPTWDRPGGDGSADG